MQTVDALEKLALQEVRQVWLEQGGRVQVVVTYDPQRRELLFRPLRCRRHSLTNLLFQTRPSRVL